jgi:hypothetical protein
MPTTMTADLPSSIVTARSIFDRLDGRRRELLAEEQRHSARLIELKRYLELAPSVDIALERLGQAMFGQIAETLERTLTLSLQEVLGQAVSLKVTQEFKRGAATLKFHLERDGEPEDIMRGTGGSVANILSVGLRIFALAKLDKRIHRPFLVLDEQDCWLSPDLVPRLVKIIQDAGRTLGIQVILISHHSSALFERYADRIYRFTPGSDGVNVERFDPSPADRDMQ